MEIRVYKDDQGRMPFLDWLRRLGDDRARMRIHARVTSLRAGNRGDWKSVGGGVFELRIDHGPGYRIFFACINPQTFLILGASSKRMQNREIERSRAYLNAWLMRDSHVKE